MIEWVLILVLTTGNGFMLEAGRYPTKGDCLYAASQMKKQEPDYFPPRTYCLARWK